MLRTKDPLARTPASDLQIYLHDLNATPLLSAEEERELAARIADGDTDARDHMIRANLRLVVNLARGYLGRGLSLDDLISEGNLGLIRAVEGFDPGRGVRFSTYAAYWVKQSMRSAVIAQGRPLRLPAYTVTLLAKWRRAGAVLAERLGREPSPEEIGDALRLSTKKRAVVADALRVNALIPREDGAEGEGLAGELVDGRNGDAVDLLGEAEELGSLGRHLDELPERESTVVRMRFGLGSCAAMTLRQVGEALGLTHEAVRRIEKQAVRRLRDLLGGDGQGEDLASRRPGLCPAF